MARSQILGHDLDHVAIAVRDARSALDKLVGRLGATPLYGAYARGFRWILLHAGTGESGMFIEVLEPWSVNDDPFLERFLAARGEGAHHLTFKSSDIVRSIDRFEALGREPIDRRLDDPRWREAFVRPGDAFGTVVQLAETTVVRPPVAEMLETVARSGPDALSSFAAGATADRGKAWWHAPKPTSPPVPLRRIVFAVDDPEAAASLYRDALGGEPADSDRPDSAELAWPGGRIRFDRASSGRRGITALEFASATIEPFEIGRTEIRFEATGRSPVRAASGTGMGER